MQIVFNNEELPSFEQYSQRREYSGKSFELSQEEELSVNKLYPVAHQ